MPVIKTYLPGIIQYVSSTRYKYCVHVALFNLEIAERLFSPITNVKQVAAKGDSEMGKNI